LDDALNFLQKYLYSCVKYFDILYFFMHKVIFLYFEIHKKLAHCMRRNLIAQLLKFLYFNLLWRDEIGNCSAESGYYSVYYAKMYNGPKLN